jgi:O-methyltransferase involved in polyketide biosynthesis
MKNKISITAEFASLIKTDLDTNNLYFVSPKTKRIYSILRWIIPKKTIRNIFTWRLALSQIFDSKIEEEIPEQIIDLGAGYSLRGFNFCRKNSDVVYVDSDLEDVILRKKHILLSLCQKENIDFPKNLHLIAIDVLKDDFVSKTESLILPFKKTMIIAEGLTSYLTISEFKTFIEKTQTLCRHLPNSIFYCTAKVTEQKGPLYKAIRKSLSYFTYSRKSHQFKTQDEFVNFLKESNITKYKLDNSDSGHIIYSLMA